VNSMTPSLVSSDIGTKTRPGAGQLPIINPIIAGVDNEGYANWQEVASIVGSMATTRRKYGIKQIRHWSAGLTMAAATGCRPYEGRRRCAKKPRMVARNGKAEETHKASEQTEMITHKPISALQPRSDPWGTRAYSLPGGRSCSSPSMGLGYERRSFLESSLDQAKKVKKFDEGRMKLQSEQPTSQSGGCVSKCKEKSESRRRLVPSPQSG
jgi:hypothetical protein